MEDFTFDGMHNNVLNTILGYPWDVLLDSNTNNFGMKKWLVLSDYPQMLDKFVLYGRYMHLHNVCVCCLISHMGWTLDLLFVLLLYVRSAGK